MAIVPPDPGKALALAKITEFDPVHGGFRRGSAVRFLRPAPISASAASWEVTVVRERTVDALTFDRLRDGEPAPAPFPRHFFRSPAGEKGKLYVLADNGFAACAEEV